MPRLLIFAPCLKAITGDDGLVTLVSFIETVNVRVPADATEDDKTDAMTDMEFVVFTEWFRLPEDGEQQFEQKINIMLPSGTSYSGKSAPFHMSERSVRIRRRSKEFPVSEEGEVEVILSLRNVTEQHDWLEISRYPISVRHSATSDADKIIN